MYFFLLPLLATLPHGSTLYSTEKPAIAASLCYADFRLNAFALQNTSQRFSSGAVIAIVPFCSISISLRSFSPGDARTFIGHVSDIRLFNCGAISFLLLYLYVVSYLAVDSPARRRRHSMHPFMFSHLLSNRGRW